MNKPEIYDDIETLILMALDADHSATTAPISVVRSKEKGGRWEVQDQGLLLGFESMEPESSYTFDASDEDRIYTQDNSLLLRHPAEILGDRSEVVMMSGGLLKWYGYRRLARPPKRVATMGTADVWYESHIRFVLPNGRGEYFKRIVPLDKRGAPIPAKINGSLLCTPFVEGAHLVLCSSVIEDAHRSNAMLASVSDAKEIKFPVPLGDYKEMFSSRDGPLSNGRKRSILHWVASHLRNKNTERPVRVSKHTRGISDFIVDGIKINISANPQ